MCAGAKSYSEESYKMSPRNDLDHGGLRSTTDLPRLRTPASGEVLKFPSPFWKRGQG